MHHHNVAWMFLACCSMIFFIVVFAVLVWTIFEPRAPIFILIERGCGIQGNESFTAVGALHTLDVQLMTLIWVFVTRCKACCPPTEARPQHPLVVWRSMVLERCPTPAEQPASPRSNQSLEDSSSRLPMGARCGKESCCGLWVQRLDPGCYSLFRQSSGVGSREARLPPINGRQMRDESLTASTLLYFIQVHNILHILHVWLTSFHAHSDCCLQRSRTARPAGHR